MLSTVDKCLSPSEHVVTREQKGRGETAWRQQGVPTPSSAGDTLTCHPCLNVKSLEGLIIDIEPSFQLLA